jgi:hypothetical protein
MIEFIYGLHISGEPSVFYYVGRTKDLARRLKEHKASANKNGTKKEKWIAETLESGKDIDIKILMLGTPKQLSGQEDCFIQNLEQQGHPLTNSTGGSSPLYEYEPTGEVVPWSIELFTNAEWSKNYPNCKSNEVGCNIRGYDFYRVGKRKLRFRCVQYGEWSVGCDFSEPDELRGRYKRAIAMLTLNTPENKKLREEVDRLRQSNG